MDFQSIQVMPYQAVLEKNYGWDDSWQQRNEWKSENIRALGFLLIPGKPLSV
jgi:hypothetical protein